MADIELQLRVAAPPSRVFAAMSAPAGLDAWWTLTCVGEPQLHARYQFGFGPDFSWQGVLTRFEPTVAAEWHMEVADADWTGTHVAFVLSPSADGTRIEFSHRGWRDANEHFRVSTYCWATYLRLLKRYLEHGEVVPYAERDRA